MTTSLNAVKDRLAMRSSFRRIMSKAPVLDGIAYRGFRMTVEISKSIVSAAMVSDFPSGGLRERERV